MAVRVKTSVNVKLGNHQTKKPNYFKGRNAQFSGGQNFLARTKVKKNSYFFHFL